jgi:hypothetical protein
MEQVIPTGLFHIFAFRLRTDDPYGARKLVIKSDAFKLRFLNTNGYLGFNPGLLQLHWSGLFLAAGRNGI